MKKSLQKVAWRQGAVIIPNEWIVDKSGACELKESSAIFVANCAKLGFGFSETLLQEINCISIPNKLEILEQLKELRGVNKNWTPLVKQWNIPTGEDIVDHLITWFANIIGSKKGTKLACGHLIPEGTFPLERYNGCPFCGTPFELEVLELKASKNKLQILKLWKEADLKNYLKSLLESPVTLDVSQAESLKILLAHYDVPEDTKINIKETLMLVIDALVKNDKWRKAENLFSTPNDILRYLWYKHTGFLQIIEPKTIVSRKTNNASHYNVALNKSIQSRIKAVNDLKLKFDRAQCRMYATWINDLEMDVSKQCENMHPKRSMWVRVIRALRLAEYSKKSGFEKLAILLDDFYNENYEVWQATVNKMKLKSDAESTFKLLKQRPGLFARSLFSSMLWFGPNVTLAHFKEIISLLPKRLIFTLNMYAENYFDPSNQRVVKPLGGNNKKIEANKLLKLYSKEELKAMQESVRDLSLDVIKEGFKMVKNTNKSIFIDESLFNIPIAIGDRSEMLQDLPSALMGTKFKVEGDTVRLFMQWGEGLPAQHLDMDLSCKVAYASRTEFCSYSQLVIDGCKHSGDIQRIPNKVGTAEYIDIDIDTLEKRGAKYVSFTCNAYTNGSLVPELVVGWMNSKFPMKISRQGVAYDPTNVQHTIRVNQTLSKGMVFGVLDVEARQITWLELSFGGQVVQNLNLENVEGLIDKLEAKLKLGDILRLKSEVQDLTLVDDPAVADEVYDATWAMNTAVVSKLILN